MKFSFLFIFCIFFASCVTREYIKNKYLYSETVKQLLSDQEYYNLDKNATWPNEEENFCYIKNE